MYHVNANIPSSFLAFCILFYEQQLKKGSVMKDICPSMVSTLKHMCSGTLSSCTALNPIHSLPPPISIALSGKGSFCSLGTLGGGHYAKIQSEAHHHTDQDGICSRMHSFYVLVCQGSKVSAKCRFFLLLRCVNLHNMHSFPGSFALW